MFDWPDVAYLLVRNGAAGVLICQVGLVIREWMRGQAEVAKIRAASEGKVAEIGATADADVTRTWATSEAKIAEMHVAHDLERERDRWARRQVDRPERRLGGLSQLQAEGQPGDHGAAEGTAG